MTNQTMTLPEIKQRIWALSNGNLQTITMAACSVGVDIPITDEQGAEKVLTEITRRKNNIQDPGLSILMSPNQRRKLPPIKPITDSHDWKQRYHDAHKINCQREYPNAYRNGHYPALKSKDLPDVTKHGGLITFMVNMIRWHGGNAMPLNNATRVSDKIVTDESGAKFTEKRYIKSSRKGVADVQGTVRGKKLQLDAKVGRDVPSTFQLNEQRRERKAGGIYEFIHGPDEFFHVFDPLFYG